VNEFTAKELEFRSKSVEALRQASNNLHWFAKVVEAHNGDLLRAAVEVLDIAHDAVERVEAENAALKKQLAERQDTAASDANDWRRMWDRLTRLTADNCKLLAQNAPLMDCVRWYANPRHHAIDGGNDRAESCLRSLGLLDTDDRSGEGC
jgi:hypothetical protein